MSDEQKSAEPTSAEGSKSGPGVATELEDPLAVELRELKARLVQVEAQAGEYKDQWLRATADYKNFKRRTDIERSELIRSASSALLLKMLPVMDDFERSIANIPPEVAESAWWGGTQLIAQKLRTVLESEGVNVIAALGNDFDPNLHEAVLYEDADGQEGKVIAELQRGYKLGDRVLRPSMVKVGRG